MPAYGAFQNDRRLKPGPQFGFRLLVVSRCRIELNQASLPLSGGSLHRPVALSGFSLSIDGFSTRQLGELAVIQRQAFPNTPARTRTYRLTTR